MVIELGRLLHPGQVGAGAEVLAAAAHQQETQAWIGLDLVQRQDQFTNHLGVERVVLGFAAEPERGETTGIGQQFQGIEVAHV
ncbi:hypothetical protein D3C81_2235430 [compost metagenome]